MLGSHALRSRALFTLVIVTLFVSLCTPGLAFGAREGETSIKPIDDSGNGKPDRYEVDWDGDGTVDEEWTDPDEDGVIDTADASRTRVVTRPALRAASPASHA